MQNSHKNMQKLCEKFAILSTQFPIAATGFMSKMVQAVAENQPTNKNRDER
jgi:hypothetical protein